MYDDQGYPSVMGSDSSMADINIIGDKQRGINKKVQIPLWPILTLA